MWRVWSKCKNNSYSFIHFLPSVAYDLEGWQKLERLHNSTKLYSIYLFIIWVFKTFRCTTGCKVFSDFYAIACLLQNSRTYSGRTFLARLFHHRGINYKLILAVWHSGNSLCATIHLVYVGWYGIGDHLRAGKPSRYLTSQLSRLTQPPALSGTRKE